MINDFNLIILGIVGACDRLGVVKSHAITQKARHYDNVLRLTARTNKDDARLPTLINIYKSVEYHERECYEMLGVYFEGHPRNERFLLPEDWADIPPLRKDFRIKGR